VAIGGSSVDPSIPGADGRLELGPIEAVILAVG
jgi:hypothetical protein